MTEDELTVIETAFLSYAERINSKKHPIYFMSGAFCFVQYKFYRYLHSKSRMRIHLSKPSNFVLKICANIQKMLSMVENSQIILNFPIGCCIILFRIHEIILINQLYFSRYYKNRNLADMFTRQERR